MGAGEVVRVEDPPPPVIEIVHESARTRVSLDYRRGVRSLIPLRNLAAGRRGAAGFLSTRAAAAIFV